MPSAEAVSLTRDADALRFGGELLTPRIRDTWTRALPMLAGVRRFDVAGVTHVDSAGIALLAELAQRAGAVGVAAHAVRSCGASHGVRHRRSSPPLRCGR